jgi:small subunit ribosomal protein S18
MTELGAATKRMPRQRHGKRPPKRRRLTAEESARLNYSEVGFLRQFLTERGKIKSRSATGLSRRDQARLARAVKQARELALLPYRTDSAQRHRAGGRR